MPFEITSSNSSIISIHDKNQIIPKATGSVTLSFVIPESEFYLVSDIFSKKINVVSPTLEAWREFRKSDVRYEGILERFTQRYMALNPDMTEFLATEKARKVFNEDYSDSDGMGTAIYLSVLLAPIPLVPTEGTIYLSRLFATTTNNASPLFATRTQYRRPENHLNIM